MRFEKISFCGVLALIIWSTGIFAQKTVYPEEKIVFPHGLPSSVHKMDDGLLMVKNGWTRGYGLMGFKVSDPARPELVRGTMIPGYASGQARTGDTGYQATGFGFCILNADWSLKRNILVDFSASTWSGSAVFVYGLRLLLVGRPVNRIYDIRDPQAPLLLVHDAFSGWKNFVSHDNVLYCWKNKTLSRIDGENLEPAPIHEFDAPIKNVLSDGQVLYVLTNRNVLWIVNHNEIQESMRDVSNIRSTRSGVFAKTKGRDLLFEKGKTKEFVLPKEFDRAMEYDGQYFYVLEKEKLCIYQPENGTPVLKSTTPIVPSDGDMLLTEDAMYLTGGSNLYVLDRKKKYSGVFDAVLTVELPKGIKAPSAYNALFGNYLYPLPGKQLAFYGHRIDISEPLKPRIDGLFAVPFNGATTVGKELVLTTDKGVNRYDLEKLPESVVSGTHTSLKLPVTDVVSVGKRLLVLRNGAVDILDSDTLNVLSTHPVEQGCAMASDGAFVYIPEGSFSKDKKLFIYDVKNDKMLEKKNLLEQGALSTIRYGDSLFVSSGISVDQYNIRDPRNPVKTAEYVSMRPGDPPGQSTDFSAIAIDGGRLYARNYSGICIWPLEKEEAK